MDQLTFSNDDVRQRGKELYRQHIRARVETAENIGKVVIIDVSTGDYKIDEDRDNPVEAALYLQQQHPGAALWGERIGYDTVFALGGAELQKTTK